MLTFIKVQAASILGSLADYLATIILVEIFNCWYLLSNFAGNIFGGSVQFILCRTWAFKIKGKVRQDQVLKFFLVFSGNLVLSAAGIFLFTHFLRMNYVISKTITSILLGLTYNYFMQKKFVFGQS
jgi:putative flippase GtrA